MIPKIIHYAWVGGEIPDEVKNRVKNWKKVMPEWTFMFWNEDDWDFNSDLYSQEKIKQKKYGFAIDVLRYDVIYKYGGFYLDTDMILNQSLDSFLDNHNVFGLFYKNSITTAFFGAEKGSSLVHELYKVYTDKSFMPILYKAAFEGYTSNPIVTNYFINKFPDFELINKTQVLNNNEVSLYNKETFTYQSFQKSKTVSVHLLDNTWNNNRSVFSKFKKIFIKVFGIAIWGKISAYRGAKRKEYRLLNGK